MNMNSIENKFINYFTKIEPKDKRKISIKNHYDRIYVVHINDYYSIRYYNNSIHFLRENLDDILLIDGLHIHFQ